MVPWGCHCLMWAAGCIEFPSSKFCSLAGAILVEGLGFRVLGPRIGFCAWGSRVEAQ